MDQKNWVATSCASCGGKDIPEILRPYCSVVCRALGQVGLGWRSNPCRVVDGRTGAMASVGPCFDLSPSGLADLQRKAERLRLSTPEPDIAAYPIPQAQLQPSFSGNISL